MGNQHDRRFDARKTIRRLALVLLCGIVSVLGVSLARARTIIITSSDGPQNSAEVHDGQHDFDFEIGTWKTHLSRLVHPLSGSTTWVELTGTSVVSKVWDGRANLVELEVDGPNGHVEGLSLRLYNAQSHQWSLNFANSRVGTLERPHNRRIQKWPRRVLRPGRFQWPDHPGSQRLVRH